MENIYNKPVENSQENLAALMEEILDHACPLQVGLDGTDWNVYLVETHCVEWKIVAQKVGVGDDRKWIISRAVAEDC
jgi:hypothetical protein